MIDITPEELALIESVAREDPRMAMLWAKFQFIQEQMKVLAARMATESEWALLNPSSATGQHALLLQEEAELHREIGGILDARHDAWKRENYSEDRLAADRTLQTSIAGVTAEHGQLIVELGTAIAENSPTEHLHERWRELGREIKDLLAQSKGLVEAARSTEH
jgi:hypothetical protein